MTGDRRAVPAVPIPAALKPLDTAVDDWFEAHLRHHKLPDAVMYGASALGDHGILWLALAAVDALRHPAGWRRRFIRVAAGLGIESALVNGPVKLLFRRTRPVNLGPRPMHLRQPRTSSFPSGHASAAFFGAAMLRDGDALWPLYYVLAVIVAASRIHVRIHHASDVVGGVLTGAALGELARRLVPPAPAGATAAAGG